MHAIKYIPRYTVEDYRQWEGDWELWDGIPVAMSPIPFGRHQWAATRLAAMISQQLDMQGCTDCFVLMETDWIVSDTTVVRPDVVVCCGEFPERHIETPPILIIEVLSEGTGEKDRTSKRALYASEKVPHYLMLDTTKESFQVQRLVGDTYVEQLNGEPIQVSLHQGCELSFIVPRLPPS